MLKRIVGVVSEQVEENQFFQLKREKDESGEAKHIIKRLWRGTTDGFFLEGSCGKVWVNGFASAWLGKVKNSRQLF